MRALVLSQYYDPEPIPKPAELARALQARGHQVIAITGLPNYPSGKLYAGFGLHVVRRETRDGIPVLRTFEYPYHGRSVIGRLANYLSFVLSAPLAALLTERCDVMYVWHPPLTVGLAAWIISVLRGTPFVYDVQDIWPESAILSGLMKEGALVRLMFALERFVYRRATHVFVVTEGARENLIKKGVEPQKITVMPYWIDENLFHVPATSRAEIRQQFEWKDRFVVMFAGNLGIVQSLDSVIRAAALLPAPSRVLIVLVGDGSDRDRIVALATELGVCDRVRFIERQPMSQMPGLMDAADALLVHLRRSDLSRYIIPSKTLAYLAAGRPIVMAMEGAAADLVQEAGAGIVVASDDPEALAKALVDLEQMPESERAAFGARGEAYAREKLTKEQVIPRYEEVLLRVAGAVEAKQKP